MVGSHEAHGARIESHGDLSSSFKSSSQATHPPESYHAPHPHLIVGSHDRQVGP
jgi:hypothetical protein